MSLVPRVLNPPLPIPFFNIQEFNFFVGCGMKLAIPDFEIHQSLTISEL